MKTIERYGAFGTCDFVKACRPEDKREAGEMPGCFLSDCTVEDHNGAILCTFADGNDLLFQGDDMTAFLSSCWPAGCETAEDVEGVLDDYYHLAVEMVENK